MTEHPPWFERWPELAEWEIGRFRARGLPVTEDECAKAAGRLVLRSQIEFRGQTVNLEIEYPAETPELPPQVYAQPGLLERHQHPLSGNFCLLERPLDDWPALSWGAADLIAERLRALLDDMATGPEAVAANEAPIPEPHTAFYDYPFGPVVLMSANLSQPALPGGIIRLRTFDSRRFRFVVEAVDGIPGDQALLDLLPHGPTIEAKWRRVPESPPVRSAAEVAAWIRASHPGLLPAVVPRKLAQSKHLAVPDLHVSAFVFEEEGPVVGEQRDGWLFLCVPKGREPFLAHWQLVSAQERFRRTPDLRSLADKRAVVVGLGSLGGELAVALAKSGIGHLDLIDRDRFEANNAVRHVLGVEWSGFSKTQAVAAICRRANPFCQVEDQFISFGETGWEGDSSVDRLTHLLSNADVVVETTGSHQLQRFVARVAQDTRTPFVSSGLTDGFWGGECVRVVPGRSSCFVCFATDKAEGRLIEASAGPATPVVVQGCSHPTVSGAGFDASELAVFTARLAVQTILQGDGYPQADWDYAVLSFRDREGRCVPSIRTERLLPREGCDGCHLSAGSKSPH